VTATRRRPQPRICRVQDLKSQQSVVGTN
jgi:hypothetical protein